MDLAGSTDHLMLWVTNLMDHKALKHKIVVLQHPQEPDKALGSVPTLLSQFPEISLKIGLSWPNLKKATGQEGAIPKNWGVLYLGSGFHQKDKSQFAKMIWPGALIAVDKKGMPIPEQKAALSKLEGLIFIDGTWSQAKALWWRNAWLTKVQRLILVPPKASLYGKLRKEPRKECLSTLESVAYAVSALGEPKIIETQLIDAFQAFLSTKTAEKKSTGVLRKDS